MPAWGRVAVPFLIVLLAAPSILAATSGPSQRPTQSVYLRVGSKDEMKTRNVYTLVAWEDTATMEVLARVYDTPVQRNATTGAIVPRLAVGIDQNGNGRLDAAEVGDFTVPVSATVTVFYDFRDATFHDGVPVTAMDLLFSYHAWALHPTAGGSLRVLMDRAGHAGSNFTRDRWLGVERVDDGDGNPATDALRFILHYRFVNFAWATLGIPVLPRHIWEGTGGGRHANLGLAIYPDNDSRAGQGVPTWEVAYTPFDSTGAQDWNPLDADVIGSGHFRFGAWTPGIETRLDAFTAYAFGRPKVDGILFRVYANSQLVVLALIDGIIDLILESVHPDYVPDLLRSPGVVVGQVPDLFPMGLFANVRRAPWGYDQYPPPNRTADAGYAIRRAFDRLVDRATIATSLLAGQASPAGSLVSPANDGWSNTSLPPTPYDVAGASAILDSAGYPDPPGACSNTSPAGCRSLPWLGQTVFEILTADASYDPVLAASGVVSADAMRQVGLNARARPTNHATVVLSAMTGNFDLFIDWRPAVHGVDPWTLARGDPDYLWDDFHSSNAAGGYNVDGFADAPFDAAADFSRYDSGSRLASVRDAQGILADRLPAVPIVYRNWIWAYREDHFKGWVLAGTTLFNYWTLQGLHATPPNPGPVITLVSPPSGALVRAGTVIDFDVNDTDLVSFNVTVSGAASMTVVLPSPFDLDTTGWADGTYSLLARAMDATGNTTTASYSLTFDSTPPSVALVSPANNSLLRANVTISFVIADPHLAGASIKIDGGTSAPFAAPYTFRLEDFLSGNPVPQGDHNVTILAADVLGNARTVQAAFRLDTLAPTIVDRSPEGASPTDVTIRVRFSEAVNQSSAEAAFSLTDGSRTWHAADGSLVWATDGMSFTFVPTGRLGAGRTYQVRMAGSLTDEAGNPMGQDAAWQFSTPAPVSPVLLFALPGLLAAVLLLAFLFVRRRKKAAAEAGPPPTPS